MLHWLVLVPYYFFAALALTALLTVASRLARPAAAPHRIALTAIWLAVAGLAVALGSGLVGIADLSFLRLLLLAALSFLLAGVDALLRPRRPLAAESAGPERDFSAPQID